MAKVKLQYIMADGEILACAIQTGQDHPDALTDCANRAVNVLKEALNEVLATYRVHAAAMAEITGEAAPEVETEAPE
jgi:hypothetical protein